MWRVISLIERSSKVVGRICENGWYKNAGKDRPLLPTWSCPGNVPDDRSLSIQKYQSCIVSVDRPVYAFLNRLLFYFETVQFRRASTLIH